MSGRNRTNADGEDWTLTQQQETAVDLLVSGRTITDTALVIEVRRQTVSEWIHHHPGFQVALHSRRAEVWEGTADRLRGLLPRALDVLERELDGAQSLAAAVHVLKSVGLYGSLGAPQGPTELEDAEIVAKRKDYDRLLAGLAASPL